ncbi:MAG: dCTP deaminase [Alphaproteobacteria bacterium]|nr:dCTP deaminase [Alphaproteobacteria bacterium]
MLSDIDIRQALREGRIKIHPEVQEANIRPTGIRLHLADQIAYPEPDGAIIELSDVSKPKFRHATLGTDGIVLTSNQFILASTVEQISASADMIAQLDGRSTLARLGVMVHCGSMTIDNIHEEPRAITLEIINLGPFPVRLRSGDGIGMLFFSALQSAILQPASAQYRGQRGATPPILRKVS